MALDTCVCLFFTKYKQTENFLEKQKTYTQRGKYFASHHKLHHTFFNSIAISKGQI